MARRRLLSDEQMAPFWAWASDEREIVRHYTLSAADIELVAKRRAGAMRLGFAVLLCGMRFPGRLLDVPETPPAPVLAFIADQVGVPASEFAAYRQRGYRSQLVADVRNAATGEEAYFVDNDTYSTDCASLPGFVQSDGVVLDCSTADSTTFEISGSHPSMAYTTGCTWKSDPGTGNANLSCS